MHSITDINPALKTGVCAICGPVKIRMRKNGKWPWLPPKWVCGKKYGKPQSRYRLHLKPTCERCGFVPEDKCQLDIHHRDGNHKNNDPSNLGTLCANCHRLQHCTKVPLPQISEKILTVDTAGEST